MGRPGGDSSSCGRPSRFRPEERLGYSGSNAATYDGFTVSSYMVQTPWLPIDTLSRAWMPAEDKRFLLDVSLQRWLRSSPESVGRRPPPPTVSFAACVPKIAELESDDRVGRRHRGVPELHLQGRCPLQERYRCADPPGRRPNVMQGHVGVRFCPPEARSTGTTTPTTPRPSIGILAFRVGYQDLFAVVTTTPEGFRIRF